MNKPLTLRQNISRFGAPLLVIGIVYLFAFHLPGSRLLTQRLAKQHKLSELIHRRESDPEMSTERLAALQAEERSLDDELASAKQSGARLVTRRADCTAEFLSTTSPASLLSQALDSFEQHGLECVDTQPATEQANAPANSQDPLKSVAELLGQPSSEATRRREVRLTLRGRFDDMRRAIRELPTALPCVYIVSLEMEAAADESGQHIWTVTILV
jgi:hypothetical protein